MIMIAITLLTIDIGVNWLLSLYISTYKVLASFTAIYERTFQKLDFYSQQVAAGGWNTNLYLKQFSKYLLLLSILWFFSFFFFTSHVIIMSRVCHIRFLFFVHVFRRCIGDSQHCRHGVLKIDASESGFYLYFFVFYTFIFLQTSLSYDSPRAK